MDGDLFKGMNTKFSGNKTMPTPSSKSVTAIQRNKSKSNLLIKSA